MSDGVFLSPSLQEHNPYVGGLGVESDHMFAVAEVARTYLRAKGVRVGMSPRAYIPLPGLDGLKRAVADSNKGNYACHVAVHSNAGPKGADGTDTYYHLGSRSGLKLAKVLQGEVAPVSPGTDGGVHANTTFYELSNTVAPAALIEVVFHTDPVEAKDIAANYKRYGVAISKAVCLYLGVPWVRPIPPEPVVNYVPLKKAAAAVAKSLNIVLPEHFHPDTNQLGEPARALLRAIADSK